MKGYAVAGLDLGSLTAKTVIMDSNARILSSNVTQRGLIVDEEAARYSFQKALEEANLTRSDIAFTVSTGYGRKIEGFGDKDVTELSCHARGAYYMNPDVRTIIDIGGQDSKVISIGKDGALEKFVMNDKCAAGTGRFIEVMSAALGVPLLDIGEISLQSKNPAPVSSTCVVFAESEVISLVSKGVSKVDILAGIHKAIAKRMHGLIKSVGVKPVVLMSGGVAKNKGVVHFIEETIGTKIFLSEDPQIIGAVGAALFALDYAGGEEESEEDAGPEAEALPSSNPRCSSACR